MTDLDAFLTKVLPYAPGCPEPTAFEHIRNAASDFCETTRLWRFSDTFEVGDSPNVMCTPQNAVIHEIERADFNGMQLRPQSIDWLDEHVPRWRSDEDMLTATQPDWYTQVWPDTIRVVPYCTGRLKVWLRLKPAPDADQLPDFLYREYGTVIGWGALANILMLPNQTFSDPNRAVYFQTRFDQALGRAAIRQSSGQQRAPVRVKAYFL